MSHVIRQGKISPSGELQITGLADFLAASPKPDSVWLDSHEEAEALKGLTDGLKLIALNFPVFSDGRSYSNATLLRRQFNFRGEILATGDVRVDQLDQMARCGFDAFQLAEGQNAELGLKKLSGFSFSYQTTIDREPIFRKRADAK